jgi:hypothetical protein
MSVISMHSRFFPMGTAFTMQMRVQEWKEMRHEEQFCPTWKWNRYESTTRSSGIMSSPPSTLPSYCTPAITPAGAQDLQTARPQDFRSSALIEQYFLNKC